MNIQRRIFLKAAQLAGLLVAGALIAPARALAAWNKAAFEAKAMPDALKAAGAGDAERSADIVINAPEAAENGSMVPVDVTSRLPGTESIVILVEKNNTPLVADFSFANGADAYVSTRIKMSQTSAVHAVVRADGRTFTASKDIKVTIGGCGG